MTQKKSNFPLNLSYPVSKAKELIESLEKDIDNPKAKKFKKYQREMSVKARELKRLSSAITSIIGNEKPYDKKKTPSCEAIVRSDNSNQK